VHTPAPTREYCPAWHSNAVALVDPAGHTYPAVQGPVHVDTVRPVPDPKKPASQGPVHVDTVMPVDDPYRPAGHCPLQADVVAATVVPKVPSGHTVQAAAPASAYCPATHCTAVLFVLPAGHAFPAVQFPEHAAVVMFVDEPKVPPGHNVHEGAPCALYCPLGHTDVVALVEPAGHEYPALHGPAH
jgi:hypothetical protein